MDEEQEQASWVTAYRDPDGAWHERPPARSLDGWEGVEVPEDAWRRWASAAQMLFYRRQEVERYKAEVDEAESEIEEAIESRRER